MSLEENKALARRLVDEALNHGNVEIADELFTDDFVDHQGGVGPTGGREDAKQFVGTIRTAFPNVRFEIEHIGAEGHFVFLHLVARGTHLGDFQGIAPTDRQVTFGGMGVLRIAGGKVAERWNVQDASGLMQQLAG